MTAIQTENLGKSYFVGHNSAKTERYTALRDVLVRNARDLARKTFDMFKGRPIIQGDRVEEFWALQNINLLVKSGERVGIIGRNGAGKSTLLKLLSRITEPTTGRITICGRVASLLEVGTGFHPELTGKENIYLNGAILGMTRREIQNKIDQIIDFAEVENFIDTPVKRYSSGMYVRLAFSVAAHLEPEILIVDEVLAVGDAQFQKKCLNKMEGVASEGRTVLFVSHNMDAISTLCDRAILLKNGNIAYDGLPYDAINAYMDHGKHAESKGLVWRKQEKTLNCEDLIKIIGFDIIDNNDLAGNYLYTSKPYQLKVYVEVIKSTEDIRIAFAIYQVRSHVLLMSTANDNNSIDFSFVSPGLYVIEVELPVHLLASGAYEIELLSLVECNAWILPGDNESRLSFDVCKDDSKNPHAFKPLGGFMAPIYPTLRWSINKFDHGDH